MISVESVDPRDQVSLKNISVGAVFPVERVSVGWLARRLCNYCGSGAQELVLELFLTQA